MAAFSKNKILKTFIYIFSFFLCSAMSIPFVQADVEDKKDETNIASPQPDIEPTADASTSPVVEADASENEDEDAEEEVVYHDPRNRIIKEIIIDGNIHVPTDAILDRIPYRIGEPFDLRKTRTTILRLYHDLKRFRDISIYGEDTDDNKLILYIDVLEKPVLTEVIYKGNSQVKKSEIEAAVTLKDLPAIDPEELTAYAQQIKKIYLEKGYFLTDITGHLEYDADGNASAIFDITEHKQSLIKRITFSGNSAMSDKALRGIMYSREDWILGALDKSGLYMPDRVEMGDKQAIEQYYQNNGYLNAKVVDIATNIDPKGHINLAIEVKEGEQYKVNQVLVPGNDIIDERYLEAIVPIKAGNIYSREAVMNTIKLLEKVWGDFGYIYAHIEPSIIPNDTDKTVNISFHSDIGKQVFLNKISIRGNQKTKDKIIRRNISLEEGDLLTNSRMEGSKNRIESLGYFEQRDGVNWKINRKDDNNADLELMLKEARTGNAHLKLGFGGSPTSLSNPLTGVSVEGNVTDTNLFGTGVKFNLTGSLAREAKTIVFNLTQPWLFDKPIYGALDIYHKRLGYDELRFNNPITQKNSGGIITLGTMLALRSPSFTDTFLRFNTGLENIQNEGDIAQIRVQMPSFMSPFQRAIAEASYRRVIEQEFSPGSLALLAINIGQDKKNHPMHPSHGYTWLLRSAFGFPVLGADISYNKLDLEGNWFTPLIQEIDLVFRIHGYMGIVTRIHDKTIPYRELYNIGGPASVRGFLFGEIGPQFRVVGDDEVRSSPIGGRKAAFVNVELIFPITPDFSMKGLFFYDGGAGWDNPYSRDIPAQFLANNSFSYRHAIGAGVRILNPVPVRIDWGFKLDARKGESAHEVHFGMTYDW
jgi:outer membrane protein insertion porin family